MTALGDLLDRLDRPSARISRYGMSRSTDGSRGRPSTFSPMMLCWISSVPPAIDCAGTDSSTSVTIAVEEAVGPGEQLAVGAGEQRVGPGRRPGDPAGGELARASPPTPAAGRRPRAAWARRAVHSWARLQRDAAPAICWRAIGSSVRPCSSATCGTRSARPARCGYQA